MDEQTRLKARELLLRSRIYRFTALVCAAFGLVVFLFLYFRYIKGDIVHALGNPTVIGIIVLPFLPAVIVSWMAVRAENKLMATLEQLKEPGPGPANTDNKARK